MPLHDLNYKHWAGRHLGVWERRWVIARHGLTACLQVKLMRHIIVLCWGVGLVAAAIIFMMGQLLVADSEVFKWTATMNPTLRTFVAAFIGWVNDHPELSVGTTQNVLFYYASIWLMRASIFALGMAIPLLITRDLACNAIVIYSSKAVSRGDYLLGKFAAAFGLLTLTWLGPVCGAWLVGNLLAPDWSFFWHARLALENMLVYGVTSMIFLSVLSLGVSAMGVKEKSTTAFWFIWWILGAVLAPIALHTQPWLLHLSFNFNLNQIALATFRVGDNIDQARSSIPILSNILGHIPPGNISALATPDLLGTWLGLGAMLGLAAWVLHRKVKPE